MITIHGARYLGIHNGMSAMKITHRGTLGLDELFSVTIGNYLRNPRREVSALRRDLIPARRMFSLLAHLQNCVADKSGMTFLPNRDLVFVVDDDRAILKGIARVLRQYGYNTVLFSSAEAFKRHDDFDKALCVNSRHQPERWIRHRAEASPESGWEFFAGHLHDCERQPCRSCGCASIRMHRLSHKADLGEVAD
jgi:hypothetical protein